MGGGWALEHLGPKKSRFPGTLRYTNNSMVSVEIKYYEAKKTRHLEHLQCTAKTMIFTVYSGDREEVSDKLKEKTQDMCIL